MPKRGRGRMLSKAKQHDPGAKSMHDIVNSRGTILDGTAPSLFWRRGIDGGKIAEIGGKAGPGTREITRMACSSLPAGVDVHTHYDGPATWDPILAPSSWHGVTTILFGNCGVGFAPVRRETAPAHRPDGGGRGHPRHRAA